MWTVFPPFQPPPQNEHPKQHFRRAIPIRVLIPNLITILALCAGLSAMRMAIEGRIDTAVYFLLTAAILDALDGRIARLLHGSSRFGAELDSLADFVSFGAAPALIIYLWSLKALGSVGWIVSLVFAICGGLRLARFNVSLDNITHPSWMSNFFVGMPIPAGALVVLLPLYIDQFLSFRIYPIIIALYTLLISFLMISTLPIFSGKKMSRIDRRWVLPILLCLIIFFGLLLSYPWLTLSLGSCAYLSTLPLGFAQALKLARTTPPSPPLSEEK